ncbi:MAG: FAD-binding oxidoreductase [Pseudomonadota bacterium]|nr:FAD-binding oxidoreductase [Pseudomonadota bacterium]
MKQNNLWQETSEEKVNFKALNGSLESDIAIVGGGYTGCSAALAAAENGLSVSLVDQQIGFGGSGRNVGLVNSGLWLPPKKVEHILGQNAGIKLNKSLSSAPDLVFKLIDKYKIDCNANRSGTLHCAHSHKGLEDIQNRYQQLTERGAELELLDREEAEKRIGSSKFYGALLNKKAGTINPLSYCQGLAKAAQYKSANIFESSLATKIEFQNNFWITHTKKGSIKSKKLLIATNAYLQGISGIPSSKYTPVYYFQAATKPLSEEIIKNILPKSHGCWDTATVMSSFRLDNQNRFIIGGIGNLGQNISKIHSHWAKRKAQTLFPSLNNISFDYFWGGQIAMTDNHIPKIYRIGYNAYSIFGYSGRGIGPGTYFGKSIAETFLNDNEDSLPIKPTSKNNERFGRLKGNFIEFGAKLNHLI